MIWGSQYDTMLNWAKKGTDKNKITNASLGNISSESVSVTTTGNSKYSDDSINNIRDLGGNLVEWTLEACGAGSRVERGSSYSKSDSPSCRGFYYPSYAYSTRGSRLTLYIK